MDPGRNRWKLWVAVTMLLGLHVALAFRAVTEKSVTVDEIFHLTGGYLFNHYGDFRIHVDNGVLPQRWHALPLGLGATVSEPVTDDAAWSTANVYAVSRDFFYRSGHDHWPLLLQARAMNLCWSVGAGLLVFFWARRLAGDLAGLTALALLALSPTFLAHGPLATSDLCATLLLPGSAGAYWWHLRSSRRYALFVSAGVFGLACIAKYSAVLLLPTFLVLAAIHFFAGPPAERNSRRLATGLLVHGVFAVAIIWAAFGFRYGAFAPELPAATEYFRLHWDTLLANLGWQEGVIAFCRDWRLLPEGFLFGYSNTYVGAQTRGAFLAGDYSRTGWIQFFPLAFLWKSTGAELVGSVLAVLAASWHWRKLRSWLRPLAPLLAWTAIYGLAALFSHLNIGHRHLLPLYPGLFIVTGVAVARLTPLELGRGVLASGLVALQVWATAGIHPHYLAYFNALAGGPTQGHRLLVDSSLDWGQDLPALAGWLQTHNSGASAQPVFLSYFGSGEPDYYHLVATRLPFVNGFQRHHVGYEPGAGIYCVSATMLQQVYSPYRGDWTAAREKAYQEGRSKELLFRQYWSDPGVRAELMALGIAEEFEKTWRDYDLLRFARLCHYLRARAPDATAGYSILIYRLSREELAAALDGNTRDLATAITRAQASRP